MSGDTGRSRSIAVRLTEGEAQAIEARAACEGEAKSAYIRSVLLAQASRPLPNLAAGAELLAICNALLKVAESSEPISAETREFVRERAEMVFEILTQHGHSGTKP
tara:strand:- start:11047 stop:11364 length:318 start_codon:yes stop_codon:yes gene_type:complete